MLRRFFDRVILIGRNFYIAYLIDENFEKIREIGEAEGVLWLGDFFMVRNGESRQLYPVDEN